MKRSLLTMLLFLLWSIPGCGFAGAAGAGGSAGGDPLPRQPKYEFVGPNAPVVRSSGQNISSYTLYTLPPEPMRESQALYRLRTVLYFAGIVYEFAVLALLLAWRIAPRYRDLAERLTHRRLLQAVLFIPLLLLTHDLLLLPLEFYRHHLGLAYGLSVQGWGAWLWDRAKVEMVTLLVAVPALWALYGLIRRSPRRWWLHAWIVALPLLACAVWVAPVVIDPLFSDFAPLDKARPELVSAIEQIAQRGGLRIPRSRIFQMNASEKFTTYNAYVTGIASTKRVVVWDTTARDLTIPEVQCIFGHEMGHYVLNHVYKGLAFAAASLLAALALGKVLIDRLLAVWRMRWGIRGLADWASLPALMLVFAVLAFLGEPLANGFSRHLEHQADIYELEVTHGIVPNAPEVAARDFQLLGEKSLSYPHPNWFFVFWSYDHPPISDRLRFALTYNPWGQGGQTKYVH